MTKDEALRLALEFIPSISPAFICEASHHKKHEQHASNESCPHVAKQKKVYEAIKAALEAKDEPVAHSVVAGALFDFMGWLTSREKRLILSSVDEASPAVEAITEFAKKRNLSLKYAEVGYWMEFLSTPPQQEAKDEPVPVAIVEVFGKDWRLDYMALPVGKHKLYAQQYTYTTPPQQEAKDEPVAWISPTELLVMRGNALGGAKDWRVNVGLKAEDGDVGLYTTPPQRKPLTIEQPKVRTGDCLLVGVCASEGHKIQPQRTWVGLTDEDLPALAGDNGKVMELQQIRRFAKAIEAKLKEKNT